MMASGMTDDALCTDYAASLENLSSIHSSLVNMSISGGTGVGYYGMVAAASQQGNMSHLNYSLLCPAAAADAPDYRSRLARPMELSTLLIVIIYGLISAVGLIGNALVIFVIARYTKMKTVTNMYIVNLSVADGLFLLGLPMVMTTAVMRQWMFGMVLCKVYYILTCINMFTSAFTLTVMAGDRYLAACYPITSMQYRTPRYAMLAIVVIWLVSLLVMLPVVLYADISDDYIPGVYSCSIAWPAAHAQTGQKIFLTYTLLLGFVIPVAVITILYSLLIIHLSTSTHHATRSAQRRRSHKKVTKLVTLIISVYIVFWLPYWVFQIDLIVSEGQALTTWKFNMFKVFTLLSYANSMMNPLLYAFTNTTFREAFIGAFRCASDHMIGGGRRGSDFPSALHTAARSTQGLTGKTPLTGGTAGGRAPGGMAGCTGGFLDPADCEVTMLTATVSGNSLNVATQTDHNKLLLTTCEQHDV